MATSILGKRTRSTAESAENSTSARVKRRALVTDFNDENENPFISRPSRNTSQDGDSMDLENFSKPSKRGTAATRISLSASKSTTAVLQTITPHTPRHRDALSKVNPSTPRHRVVVGGKPLTPRTPRTPLTPGGSITTVYSKARQLFTRSTDPGRLIGREAEREQLYNFVHDCINKTAGGCTYVSGPPGTGKSAMVQELTEGFEESTTMKKAYINCMSIKTSKDLYGNLLEILCEDIEVLEGDEIKTLQGKFVPKRSKIVYVVTLDEIDHILTLDLEFMYKLFEWSLRKSSHLILIGIANALDLTDRFLPRLKGLNLKPQLLPFLPYTASEIKNVIITRLKSLVPANSPKPDCIPFLHPAAIELCSRKVASQSGDLRKAFDICRRAIDVIETETKQKHEQELENSSLLATPSKRPLEENANLASPGRPSPRKMSTLAQSLAKLTVETAPVATIAHMNKITSSTFSNGTNQRLKNLNLQQKAALCALVAHEKRKREAAANLMATPSKSKNLAPTIKVLYGVYSMLCSRDSVLHPLTSTEFRDVVGSLETLSLISAVDGRNGSFISVGTPSKRGKKVFGGGVGSGDEKRVASCVSEREVLAAVDGVGAGILKGILSGEGLE